MAVGESVKAFPQGLKPIGSSDFTLGLKPQPPKEKAGARLDHAVAGKLIIAAAAMPTQYGRNLAALRMN